MSEQTQAEQQPRILIVDDDPNAVEILRLWLAREGYATRTAFSGPACLQELEDNVFDVILLDVMMPGMDGLEVCAQLQANEKLRSIPVVLLTARDDMETRARGMALGVSEYLTKPVNKQDLFERLRAQVHSHELHRRMSETASSFDKAP